MAIEAFADESFAESTGTTGFYILAAVMVNQAEYLAARELVSGLSGRRPGRKLHWTEMDSRQRREAVLCAAGLEASYVVSVGSPVPPKRQERARAACLQATVFELYACGIERLYVESRTPELDRRDVKTVMGARFSLPKDCVFFVHHHVGAEEPLLWFADIVAGSVRAARLGQPEFRRILGDRVTEISVTTTC